VRTRQCSADEQRAGERRNGEAAYRAFSCGALVAAGVRTL
jgi:hypothetical protein